MPYRGHVSGGVVVLDDPIRLPEGTMVMIRPDKKTHFDPTGIAGSWIDDRTAEQIVKDIRQSRHSKK